MSVPDCRLLAGHWLVLFLMLSAWTAPAVGDQSAIALPAEGVVDELKYQALTRPDPDRTLDPQALLADQTGFRPFDPDLDRQAPATWLKFRLLAPAESEGRYVLRVSRRLFDHFELHVDAPDRPVETYRADSTLISANVRTVGRQFVFDLEVPPGEVTTLLLHVSTLQSSLQPLDVWIQDASGFDETRSLTFLIFGLIFGALIALIFHNFILYLNLRLRGHLYYVFAMTSMLVLLGLDSGLIQTYILPEFLLSWSTRLNILFAGLMVATIALFFRAFVHSKRNTPRLDTAVLIGMVLITAMAVVQVFLPGEQSVRVGMVLQLTNVFVFILLIIGGVMAGRRGTVEGWIFVAAWSVFLLSALSRTILTLDFVRRDSILEYLMYFGAVVEASILALGLSYRVRKLYERHTRALREQHRAARLANTDALTAAYNRRFLQHYLENMLDEKSPDSFRRAVLILDLDNFKEANDEFGHAAGDQVLRDLVGRCQRVLRESDVLCRLGGDEFVIVLADHREVPAMDVANRLLDEIGGSNFTFEGLPIRVTTSIGVVSSISPKATVSDILRMADQALYQAKQAGRNQATLFDPDKATPFRHGVSMDLTKDEFKTDDPFHFPDQDKP